MNRNSLLRIKDLSIDEIYSILDDAEAFLFTHRDWQLPQRKLIANLFFENSTRTHQSFVSAQLQLGAKISDFHAESSSVKKGETLYDTVKTFEAIGYDALVIRDQEDEYFNQLNIDIPILNAGDGCGNHPTQCLLDLLTIRQEFHRLDNLNIVIIGDIDHSRVAHSNREALELLGSKVRYSGPEQWITDKDMYMDIDEAIKWADVVMLLRIQHERHDQSMQMSKEAYLQAYGLTKSRYERMKKDAIIMHPAPVNRDVEIDSELVESDKSRIFKQMSNGVLVRKAVIKRAFGYTFDDVTGGKYE